MKWGWLTTAGTVGLGALVGHMAARMRVAGLISDLGAAVICVLLIAFVGLTVLGALMDEDAS